MAFTQQQYDTVLEAINNTNLPTNLKADMVQIMNKGNPAQPRDFKQEFLDLPLGTVVQFTEDDGGNRVAVRPPYQNINGSISLLYSGTPDDMRGFVIDGGTINGLPWSRIVSMTVLAPKEPEPVVPESFVIEDHGGVEWIALHSVEQVKEWHAQDTADFCPDVVAPYRGENPARADWDYVAVIEIIDGERNVSFPVYGYPNGTDCSFGQDIIDVIEK